MEWSNLLLSERLAGSGKKAEQPGRTPFHKDHDRVIFSAAFRRLQRKTQVHPLPFNDHVHTRLVHSLEVSCVGRTLGTLVGERLSLERALPAGIFSSDIGTLVQVGCLAHDIGNPPFGHAGEYAIRDWFANNQEKYAEGLTEHEKTDLTLFEGNAQGFRVLTRLENFLDAGGLRLTFASLGTFSKYPWASITEAASERRKFGVFHDDLPQFERVMKALNIPEKSDRCWVRHPLVYLVEAADDICYALLDLEDGCEMKLLRYQEARDIFVELGGESPAGDDLTDKDFRRKLALATRWSC